MSDRYVEKNFLWLLALSLLLHLAVYEVASHIPSEKPKTAEQTTMVDLTDLPEPPAEPQKPRPEAPRPEAAPRPAARPTPQPELPLKPQREHIAGKRQPVIRETAPRASQESRPLPQSSRSAAPARPAEPASPAGPTARRAEPAPQAKAGSEPVTRGDGIFKPKTGEGSRPQLFPSANRLARLEESYRRKYADELEDGETRFLNTDDIRFGSFLRRLETAIYGVWRYPHEALVRGIEGTTPVRITFNRKGEIVHVELLESSGSEILDREVMRTLKQIGPIGSFPKGYSSDSFKLIAFFHYGNGGGRLH